MESSASPENVLVVVLDTVRGGSSYVGGRDLTPTLSAEAEAGADFRRAITPAPWTLPAHALIYRGCTHLFDDRRRARIGGPTYRPEHILF